MFFLGKASIAQFILIDLLLFIAVCAAYSRWGGKTKKNFSLHCVPLYFIQLFLLLILAPLRPEGLVVHLSEYDAKAVEIIPVVHGKADEKKGLKLKVQQAEEKQHLDLDLLHFKDKPRDYIFNFGNKTDVFDIIGVEIYTSFFSQRISVIKVPGNAIRQCFIPLNEQQQNGEKEEGLHNTLKSAKSPPVLLFRLSDKLTGYTVWSALIWRAFLWSILSTSIMGSIVPLMLTSKLALQHANRGQRTIKSALAYYYWSTLVVGLSLCFFVLLAEYTTRFYFRDVLSTASGVDYFYNKSYPLFAQERNSRKFRGKEFAIKKRNAFRIVVIGDSITYGQGVYPYTHRYTDLVERRMNAAFPGQNFEVINLGVCGEDLPEHIRFLHYVKDLHPDFVLYQWFINDMDFMGKMGEIMVPRLLTNRYWHAKLLNHSALYCLLQRGWRQLFLNSGKTKKYDQHIIGLFADDNSPPTKTSNERLLQLLDGIKNIGTAYGIVLFPHAAYPIKEYPFAFMHERIMKLCAQRDIPCLDLREAYASFDDHLESLWANRLDPHPSALAHDIAARKIIEFLGPDWQQQAIKRRE